MDGVNCRGSEIFFVKCFFNGFGINDCFYVEDVGVICY